MKRLRLINESETNRPAGASARLADRPSAGLRHLHGREGCQDQLQHMAVAIWVMMGVVMSVLGGVSAFSFHLWRHANIPLEPHEQLIDEDLEKYD